MPARHVEDHKWWTLTAVCVATFMLLIDITIVNVALPDIAKALHSSFTDLQWVIDAYALSLAALLLTWGALTETIGWESISYVNVPIGIAAIYISLTKVAESKDPDAGPNDWLGLITFSGGLFLLIFALVRGNAEGWTSTLIVSFLIGAAVLLVAFVVV